MEFVQSMLVPDYAPTLILIQEDQAGVYVEYVSLCQNVCCRQNPCITVSEMFDNDVLNRDILSIAVASRSDVVASRAIYNPANYRKAAYRQWIMWQHGYMGPGVRQVVPSCVVWAV